MICVYCNQDDADTIDREGKWYHRHCWIKSILAENEVLRRRVAELEERVEELESEDYHGNLPFVLMGDGK